MRDFPSRRSEMQDSAMKPNSPNRSVEEEMIGTQRIAEMRRGALLIEDQREVRNASSVLVIHRR